MVSGSMAWKLYDNSKEDGAHCLFGGALLEAEAPLGQPSPHSTTIASVEAVLTALQSSRTKFLEDLEHAENDERTFLDQYKKFTQELQCRTNCGALAGENVQTGSKVGGSNPPAHLRLSTDELSTPDLKLAKEDAWRQKEHMTVQRRKLNMLAAQTETLKAMLGSLRGRRPRGTDVDSSSTALTLPCPSCGLSIQCTLS